MKKRRYAVFGMLSLAMLGVVLKTNPFEALADTSSTEGYLETEESSIQTGMAPFDSSDGDGYDSGANNAIIRTNDTMIYNSSATINNRALAGKPYRLEVKAVVLNAYEDTGKYPVLYLVMGRLHQIRRQGQLPILRYMRLVTYMVIRLL